MGLFLYNLSVKSYILLINILSVFHPKAKKFVAGRKDIFKRIREAVADNISPVVWFHCASLGEFEQARPVLEGFRIKYPNFKICLTFFSPSGYEVRKDYDQADYIFYLPVDSATNARQFLDLIKPQLIFFVKYEFWHYYLKEANKRNISCISFSAIFRPGQLFFKSYGTFYKNILTNFKHIFVQNQESLDLLKSVGITQTTVTGDTRFDRVFQIAQQARDIAVAKQFKNGQKTLMVGSSWGEDMDVLIPFINQFKDPLKVIIAPHEISENGISQIEKRIQKKNIRFSKAKDTFDLVDYEVLIIDNVGMLSVLYKYGEFAFVGGAFKQGLHNILEPTTFGIPVFFGNKKYQKFQEAVDLIERGGAFAIEDVTDFTQKFQELYHNTEIYQQKVQICKQYVAENVGSTEKILTGCEKWV